jgi:hypothetical protein
MRSGLTVLKGVVCLVGVMMLTGAKTNGCGPDFEDGEPPIECEDGTIADGDDCVPIEPVCPEGTYEQIVCADAPQLAEDGDVIEPSECWIECLPIEPVCPDGTYEQVVCGGGEEPPFDPGDPDQPSDDGDEPQDMPDYEGPCWIECVPIDPVCPEGYHEEWVCTDDCYENCYVECVPDCNEECPEGTHLEYVCDEMGYCYETCVDDGFCGPDEHLETICEDSEDDPSGGFCYDVCVPNDPCGPGSHEEWVCEGGPDDPKGFCYSICVPDSQPCPEGQHEEWVCEEDPNDPMGGFCYPICVDDGGQGGGGGGEPDPGN